MFKISRKVNLLGVGIYLLAIVLCASCVRVDTRNITYFQSRDTLAYQVMPPITPQVTRIQPDDILAVVVSSLSEESNVLFNTANENGITMSKFGGGMAAGQQPLGYLVDSTGKIEMPLIGRVKISSYTLEQAADTIKQKLLFYLKEPTVNIRFLNHKFSVLGEVGNPGVFNLIDNHTTLPEAMAIAGDLTIYGLRKNVMLIRTTAEKREVVRIDLTQRDFFNSPYYYLRNNDVIYVDMNKGKVTTTDQRLQLLPIYISIVTTLLVVANLFRR
ncbi:polysaccharide biosynthesis/export family protein [Runella zeae]|uniref:polysaccharide biosynthesis/export family protein n=1 Tax=Runella zeae TaxID=94255 RepID=UPI0003FA6AC9|nr:polysaccharide biosynthesis/export family protein [Runella zeae]